MADQFSEEEFMMTTKSPYSRKLSREDCDRGFHAWTKEPGGILAQIERCLTCGKKAYYDKRNPNNRDYAANHKLDLLQPFGRTAQDFRKYYGEPIPINEIHKLKQSVVEPRHV